jgi:hypothetical protein
MFEIIAALNPNQLNESSVKDASDTPVQYQIKLPQISLTNYICNRNSNMKFHWQNSVECGYLVCIILMQHKL